MDKGVFHAIVTGDFRGVTGHDRVKYALRLLKHPNKRHNQPGNYKRCIEWAHAQIRTLRMKLPTIAATIPLSMRKAVDRNGQ